MNDIHKPVNDFINSMLDQQEKFLDKFEKTMKEPALEPLKSGITFRQEHTGFLLDWYYYGELQTEYYPTGESLMARIKDFLTAEKENFEVIPLKSARVEF